MGVKFRGSDLAMTGLVLFLFLTTFIYTNFPEIREVALVVFILGIVSYYLRTKPKKVSKEVKLLIFLMAASQVFNIYLIYVVPDYTFSQGIIYLILSVLVWVMLLRREKE